MSSRTFTLAGENGFQGADARRTLVFACIAGVLAGTLAAGGEWVYALGVVVAAAIVRWPVEATLGAFAFLLPFDSVSAVGSEATGATVTRYLAALAAGLLLVVGLVTRRLKAPPHAALWWAMFVIWGAAALAWALDPQMAWERMPTAISLLLLYVIATSFRATTRELLAVAALTVLGGCVAALFASGEFFGGTSFQNTARSSLMIGGRETDPNQFATSLLLPLSLAIGGLVLSHRRSVRIASIFAIAIIGFGVLLTMSRGALVAALAVVLVYLWRLKANPRVLLAVGCLALLLLFMPHTFFERLSLVDRGAGRVDIWIASLAIVPRYGILGAGWNNFVVAYTTVAGEAPHFYGYTRGSHNIYLGMLIETGIVGLAFLFLAFRSQLREARHRFLVPYEAACWGMLVSGFTLDIVWRKSFWFCWILLAMAVRYQREKPAERLP